MLFAIATLRGVHLGVLMFPAACAVGVWLAGLPLKDVVAGFPISIMVLLTGVTFFFGIAQVNGTIDRVIEALLARTGHRRIVLPFVFFGLSGAVAAMGSPQAGLVLAPVAMPIARRSGVASALMGVAINAGISSGGLAPTSLFGIVTYGTARAAGINLSPLTLLTSAIAFNTALLLAAYVLFPMFTPPEAVMRGDAELSRRAPFERHHVVTIGFMFGVVATVVGCVMIGIDPDIGVTAFAFGAVLTLFYPQFGDRAVAKIDWSTVLMVGGIITYVGVLQKLGAVDLLGHTAMNVGTPLLAAFVICMTAGLVSAFASTTGILAALVPLAVPLAASGTVSGPALICAMGVCASIVDASPFSTTGATIVASAAEDDRPRLRSLLTRWGMSLVLVGPIVLVAVLVIISQL